MLYTIVKTYLILINAIGLWIMLLDKQKARRGSWRIPEATLMGITLLGGSIGMFLGMHLFRHKTRHPKFVIGIPLILILQIVAAIWLLQRL